MTEQPDMEYLAGTDLVRADESPSFVSVGPAAADLAEAGQRYREAYARYEPFLPVDESEED